MYFRTRGNNIPFNIITDYPSFVKEKSWMIHIHKTKPPIQDGFIIIGGADEK